MTQPRYTPAQLDLLLFQGAEACKKLGYSKEFIDAAYDQITDAIEEQAAIDKTQTDLLREVREDLERELNAAFPNARSGDLVLGVLDKHEPTVTEKCEVLLLIILDRLNWASDVKFTMTDWYEASVSWSREGLSGDRVFAVSVPLYCDKACRTVADFEYMVNAIYKEIATVFTRGLR
jgi:hypothetical protein